MLLLIQYLSRFLKNGGIEESDDITPRELLKVDFKNPVNFLKNKEVFVGPLVKKFLTKLGLSPNSPEVKQYFQKVFVSTLKVYQFSSNTSKLDCFPKLSGSLCVEP